MAPAHRRRLSRDFVAAVLASPTSNQVLAQSAGFRQPQTLSSLLHAQVVVASPRTLGRLMLLAHLIGFGGPLFAEELPPVSDRFDSAHLPSPRPR